MRRLYLHESVYDEVKERLIKAYKSIKIGDPLDPSSICGPLHTKSAIKEFTEGLTEIKKQGGKVICGGTKMESKGYYVNPTLVEIDPNAEIIKTELFVPILYLFKFKSLDEAIHMNNNVPQGLSSCMFTKNM